MNKSEKLRLNIQKTDIISKEFYINKTYFIF